MNYTINKENYNLLEKILLNYGQIANSAQIFELLKDKFTKGYANKIINLLVKKGFLVQIKKGQFFVADISSRGFVSLNTSTVAQLLEKNSYVSFESALQYHNLFNQMLDTVTSVSLKQVREYTVSGIKYSFINTKVQYFFGFEDVSMDGKIIKIATVEKALLDLIHFNRTNYSVDLVIEVMKQYKENIDIEKLIEFAKKMTLTDKRIIGFVMDLLGIDSSEIYRELDGKSDAIEIASGSNNFNSKWRIYYSDNFNKYLS